MSRCRVACSRSSRAALATLSLTSCVLPDEAPPGESTATASVMLSPQQTVKWFFPEGGGTSGGFSDYRDFRTYYNFANTNPNPVTVFAHFQGDSGAWDQTFVLPANARTTHDFQTLTGRLGFHSAEFHSMNQGQEIQVASTMFNDGFDPPFWAASKAVNGSSEVRTRWSFGEGGAFAFIDPAHPVFDNWFVVYNPHDVSITTQGLFYSEDGTAAIAGPVQSVAPHSRLAFNPFSTFAAAQVAQTRSAHIDCSLPCAAQLTMYQRQQIAGRQTNTQSALGSQAATKWYLVGIPSDANWHPRMYFFNTSPTQGTWMWLRYRNASGTFLHEAAYWIAPLRRWSYDLRGVHLGIPGSPVLDRTDLSLEVTSEQPIAVTKILYWPNGGHLWSEGASTTGHAVGGTRVVFPGGNVGGGHSNYIQVMNTSDVPTTVRATFYRPAGLGSFAFDLAPIPAKGTRQIDAVALGIDGDFTTVLTSGQPIIAEQAGYFGWTGGPQLWRAGTAIEGIVYQAGSAYPTQP
jgi:hypothetical protein